MNNKYGVLQGILEVGMIIGYLGGLVPFLYYFYSTVLISLALVVLLLSIVNKNGTILFSVLNLIFSIRAMIPFVGIIPKIGGILPRV
jgi:hypothetical protein